MVSGIDTTSETKKKILIIPTYFPTRQSPITGSQVKEQSELLLSDFEIKALYCIHGMGWKRFLFQLITMGFLSNKIYRSCDKDLSGGNIAASGVYYFSSRYLPYKINLLIKNLAYKFAYQRLINSGWNPNLIHSRTAEHAGIQASYLSKLFSVPHLLTENCALIINDDINLERFRKYKETIESADKVVVVSHYLKAFLLTNNFKTNPSIVGNLVDEEVFKLKPEGTETDDFVIFTAAHTGFTKDWDTFFRVIKDLVIRKAYSSIKVLIAVTSVYDEYSRNYVKKLADQYGVVECCHIHYQVERESIVKFFHKSNVFLSTSINETFGIATLESMCCGVPVVATRNGGIEDFISEENGLLSDIGDWISLSNSIERIIEKEKTFDTAQVRNSVVLKYGRSAFKKRLSLIYKDLVNT